MIKVTKTVHTDIVEANEDRSAVFDSDTDLVELTSNTLPLATAYTLRGPSGKIGCVIGYNFYWGGVVNVWAITTKHIEEFPIAFSRTVKYLVDGDAKRFGIHRAEMQVKVGFPKALSWAKFLGFQEEGLLRQFNADKTDSILLGRVW